MDESMPANGSALRAPRVAAYGRAKRADAVAALATGPLVVARPPRPAVDPDAYDTFAQRSVNGFRNTGSAPDQAALWLPGLMDDQRRRFLLRAIVDPHAEDPRQMAALTLAAQAGAAAFRLIFTAEDSSVDVTVGDTTRTLPAQRGWRELTPERWTHTAALALVVGAPEPLADCVVVDPDIFVGHLTDHPGGSPRAEYGAALHDYLRGVDAEPAMDRALRVAARRPDPLAATAVLLSQLVAGDEQGFALALADALEAHRDHYAAADRRLHIEAAADLDILGLACHARRMGWSVPVRSEYLPESLLRGVRPASEHVNRAG